MVMSVNTSQMNANFVIYVFLSFTHSQGNFLISILFHVINTESVLSYLNHEPEPILSPKCSQSRNSFEVVYKN